MNISDAELISKLLLGDKKTWDEFVVAHSKLVYSFIQATFRKYGARIQKESVDDLHNDVFLGFVEDNFRRLRQFEGRCSLASFVRTRTVNLTIDHLRGIKPTSSIDEISESEDGAIYQKLIKELQVSPEHASIEADDATSIVKTLLNELSVDEREFVRLYYFSDMAPEQIMEQLNIKRGLYDVKKQRVLGKLSEIARKKKIC